MFNSKQSFAACLAFCAAAGALAVARPDDGAKAPFDAAMAETRANQAFAAEDYATALALYDKVLPTIDDADTKALYEERVRVAKRQLAKAADTAPPVDASPATAPAASSAPKGPIYTDSNGKRIETAPEKRKKHEPAKTGEFLETTLHELGNFDYDSDEGGNVPDDVKKLTGTKVRIQGFMLPIDQADKISRFMLVNDQMSCCLGGPPQLQHVLVVNAPAGKAVSYYPDVIVVEGTLTVEEKKEDGFIVSLFELDPTSVRPAAK